MASVLTVASEGGIVTRSRKCDTGGCPDRRIGLRSALAAALHHSPQPGGEFATAPACEWTHLQHTSWLEYLSQITLGALLGAAGAKLGSPSLLIPAAAIPRGAGRSASPAEQGDLEHCLRDACSPKIGKALGGMTTKGFSAFANAADLGDLQAY